MAIPAGPSAQAQATTARLQEANRAGRPMMIPGGAPPGAVRPAASLAVADVPARAPAAAVDLLRLEYQREGGGAPSARRPRRPLTFLARFWRRG